MPPGGEGPRGTDEIVPQGFPGADHVLIGRQGGIERPFADLRADLSKALAKLSR